MRFGNHNYLHLLWLIIPLVFFLIWSYKEKKRRIETFLGKSLISRTLHPLIWKRMKADITLKIFAVFFLILALSQPRWGYQWKDLNQKGVDIVIALDVSSSMLAQDIKPNRL